MTRHTLIMGGAGFIGSNYAYRLLQRGEQVTLYDNLSRAGSRWNLAWLEATFGQSRFHVVVGDVRDADCVKRSAQDADVIVHLAAQVAVTTSVAEPLNDFEVNAYGTLNVLEAARASRRNPVIIYASRNKVYGGMEEVQVVEEVDCYRYLDLPFGVTEAQPLDFHSPYGCSKGCGDQYVRDYHRIYGLPKVVFWQSCIYGSRQFGMEDQGWVAWFIIATVTGHPIPVYGDGKQVRDILHVDDLLNAYDLALDKIATSAGRIYNVGRGSGNTISIWKEFGPVIERLFGHPVNVAWDGWRPGDQRIYVSDIRKVGAELGWKPTIGIAEGIRALYEWINANRQLFAEL